jgi:predicted transcriptional regulator
MNNFKERLSKTGIKQSLIVELTGIKQSTISQYFTLDRHVKESHKIQIEAIINHYEQALETLKERL